MAYARARQLMQVNRQCLDDLATNALERETLRARTWTRSSTRTTFTARSSRRRSRRAR
jgi:ATP-dependent Zn protease